MKSSRHYFLFIATALIGGYQTLIASDHSADGENIRPPLLTRWADGVSSEEPWPEYPRPQYVRQDWLNLNGKWDFAVSNPKDNQPEKFDQSILVPFPVESYLSGVQQRVPKDHQLWYRRTFEIDASWVDRRILLHFGAVDWHTEVWVNDQRVGDHRGGYDPFSFDITDSINRDAENEIVVRVLDPTDAGSQPRGKQVRDPGGIWYTPVSGIWQTVWIEPVPRSYLRTLKITPNPKSSSVEILADVVGAKAEDAIQIEVMEGELVVASTKEAIGKPLTLSLDNAKLWSPDSPFLYDIRVRLESTEGTIDEVKSYFGMRSIELGTDQNGQTRIILNGKPLFQYGPLDQGYWPDGLYTPPSDEAMRYDLEITKRLGFNMVRKHVKVEPARWYYLCDQMGLLVWQDMPSGGAHAPWPADGLETNRPEDSSEQFRTELRSMVDSLWNSTSIIVWVPFNEAWGQFDTEAVTTWLEEHDPTRLVISASGGNDFGVGHINDDHFYPGPAAPPAERDRAAVLGEFGGLGLPIKGHTWQDEKNWGYRSFQTQEQLTAAYAELITKLRPLVDSHLSAAVYTQTTDVEAEVNGLLTYDRKVIKLSEETVRAANSKLYEPLPRLNEGQRVAASVLAWWRFEDGTVGESVSDLQERMGAIAARDFSGHNNHLFAFAPTHAPSLSNKSPKRSFRLVSAENRQSLDDTAAPGGQALTRDLFSNPEVARTHMDAIDRFPFSSFTIESSFCLSGEAGDQVVLSKEQNLQGTYVPLFQLGVFGSPPTIGLEISDQAGEFVELRSDVEPKVNEWYHVAVVCNDENLKLYVAPDDSSQGYQLVGEKAISGSLSRTGGTWLVGRGCESGKMGRDFLGWIDEVRISTKSLTPSQFLFAAPK